MDSKGQGALEYLLLIGGAILIAAIVIAVLSNLGGGTKAQINNASATIGNKYDALNKLS